MNKLIILFLALNSLAFAYTPTAESILRNPSNADISSSTIVANIILKKIKDENSEKAVESEALSSNSFEKLLIKLVIFKEENKTITTQLDYLNTFSKNNMRSFGVYEDLNAQYFSRNAKMFSQGVFYGLLNSLLINESELILASLKSIGVPVKSNKELINTNKVDLINRYKEYLKLVKEDADLENNLENPLKPEDEDQAKAVSDILKQPFYNLDENLTLVKKGSEFFWKYDSGNAAFTFSNESRELNSLKVTLSNQVFEFSLKDYMLFNGTHSFPRKVKINYLGEKYELTLEKLVHFNEPISRYKKRLLRYEKEVKKANPENVIVNKPGFIL